MVVNGIKRRRVINSCSHCRAKKLKCDKVRPVCGTCEKNHVKCEYHDNTDMEPNSKSKPVIKSSDEIDFHRSYGSVTAKHGPLSFFAIVNLDPFLKNILSTMKGTSKIQMNIRNELVREKKTKTGSINIVHQSNLFQALKPLISNTGLTWSLVDRFFESEVYNSCSFLQREEFTMNLINYIGPKTFPAVRNNADEPLDLIFLGTLLTMLRISSWSLYNCGYEHPHFYPIDTEAIDLAKQCYDEIKSSSHSHSIELLQFILILDFYRSNCPEDTDYFDRFDTSTSYVTAYKLAVSLGLHIDCPQDHLKRLWSHILELDTTEFIRDGSCPLFIKETSYTTKLPQDLSDATAFTRIRHRVRELVKPIMSMVTDVSSKQSIILIDSQLRILEQYLNDFNLDSILSMPNKARKTAKFLNFLDLSSIVYMVLYHILIKYTSFDSTLTLKTMVRLLSLSTPVLKLTHFLDSTKEHFFDLHKQFGTSFILVPKLLLALHKFLQLQFSLLGRTNYLISNGVVDVPQIESFEEIRKISYQNSRVVITNFGRISNCYLYAKRMNRIQSVLLINTFGTHFESPASGVYLKSLTKEEQIVDSKVLSDLIELNKTREEPPVDDMLNFIIDQDSLIELEKLLNTQSFLY